MSKQVRLLDVDGYAPGTIAVTNDEAADAWVAAGKAEYTNQADAPKKSVRKEPEEPEVAVAEIPESEVAAFEPAETAVREPAAAKKRGPGRPRKTAINDDEYGD